jgi:hypothetical protein
VKQIDMRVLLTILILPFCLLLVSCTKQSLPPIKDAECSALFQKFPTEEIPTNATPFTYLSKFHVIPKEQWPTSVAALNPTEVYKNIAGIFILPKSERKLVENGNIIAGYFVLICPNKMPLPSDASMLKFRPNSLGLIFKSTDFANIYVVEQPKRIL